MVRGAMARLLQGIDREGGLDQLFQSWTDEDDADEQRETLEHLIQALDENRPADRKLCSKGTEGEELVSQIVLLDSGRSNVCKK